MRQAYGGQTAPTGAVAMRLSRELGNLRQRECAPVAWNIRNWLKYRRRELPAMAAYRLFGSLFDLVRIESSLALTLLKGDGRVIEFGVVSRRVVTTVGVGYIVDAFQNSVELENMKYHGFGVGTTSENVSDSDMETEFTTEYATNSTRPTGTTEEGASANIFKTVATFSPDSGGTLAVTEHGVLSNATVGAGVLLDRSVFSAVNVVASSDSLVATYQLTLTAGS